MIRIIFCAALLPCLLIALPCGAAAADHSQDLSELRQMLDELTARVERLESHGDPEKAKEIEEVRALLDAVRERIEALEAIEDESTAPHADPERPTTPHPGPRAATEKYRPDFYGSLRIRALVGEGGDVEIIDRFSRIGIAAEYLGGPRWSVRGRFEAGMNLVNQNPALEVGGDPGFAFGEGSDPFVTRLGVVGFDTPFGSVSWGKQWGVYYDVAAWTDQYYTFGGEASGAYAVGDGGINGTGRAETAFQYRKTVGPVSFGLQVQNRDRTAADKEYADTFGGSVIWEVGRGLTLGAAYNEVRDGVPEPGPNEPHADDKAFIIGGIWESDLWILSGTYSVGRQRETDDEGKFFDNVGVEGFALRKIDLHWSVFGGLNWLEPDDSQYDGEYRILNFLGGVAYQVNPAVVVSGEGRLDESRGANGETLRDSVLALGVNIGW